MSQEIALLKDSRNHIAVRHGLPPIGAIMVNQYGIEWRVDGHLFVPTLATIARQGVHSVPREDLNDLYPVIIPLNLSPRLAAFLAETDRCTSKQIMPLDTLPHLRPKQAHPHSHSVDGLTAPHHILLFLDAAHVHETILAHEIGHLWIDLVEDCEDYRMLKDLSNTAKVFQWTSLQSFVLDRKVNAVLREKDFDMSIMEQHTEEALSNLTGALRCGYRPPNAHEASFLASLLAAAMLDEETTDGKSLQILDRTAKVFQHDLPDVYELACRLAASVRRHGYSNRASIRCAIDGCAELAFGFAGEAFDPDTELIEKTPTECLQDKFPQHFPGLPVAAKLEIAKTMARMRIEPGSKCRLSSSLGGSVQIEFCRENGSWTAPTLLQQAHHLPNDFALRGQRSSMSKGRPVVNKPTIPQSQYNSLPPHLSPTVAPAQPAIVQPVQPCVPMFNETFMHRSYSPGLGLFLSRVRLEEQLAGEHPYGYAMNNPTTNIDPSGWGPVRIGPVPPGVGCGDADAITDCNFSVGKPYTVICNLACDAPCTDAHEGQHRYDIASCCAKAKKCFDTAHNHAQRQRCRDRWYHWLSVARSWTECQAYRSGRYCREKMAKSQNCYAEITRGHCTPCCKAIIDGIERDNQFIKDYCVGTGWPRPNPHPCPFP